MERTIWRHMTRSNRGDYQDTFNSPIFYFSFFCFLEETSRLNSRESFFWALASNLLSPVCFICFFLVH